MIEAATAVAVFAVVTGAVTVAPSDERQEQEQQNFSQQAEHKRNVLEKKMKYFSCILLFVTFFTFPFVPSRWCSDCVALGQISNCSFSASQNYDWPKDKSASRDVNPAAAVANAEGVADAADVPKTHCCSYCCYFFLLL